MDWTIIISAIGGSAILFGTLAFLTRSIIVHFLNKDVENFKNALQLKTIEHQIRFNSLHAKRAEIIAEMYEKLIATSTILTTLRDNEKKNFSEQDKDYALKIMSACGDALRFFKTNELYFDEDLCAKIEKLNTLVFGEARLFTGMAYVWEETKQGFQQRAPELSRDLEATLASSLSRLNSEIPSLLNELKKRFRDILGVLQTT